MKGKIKNNIMKILTWNVNGFRSAIENGDLKKILNMNIDIICLQEVKISDKQYITKNIPNGYNIYMNQAMKNGYSGILILSKEKSLNSINRIGIERFDTEGRYIMLEFEKFLLYNLYIPHGGRDKKNLNYKLNVCMEIIKDIKSNLLNDKNIIITTDFNIAHNDIDLARPKQNRSNIMYTIEERKIIDKILEIGMIDSFRELHKEENNYTWWPYAFNARNRNLGWRIDYIFVSQNISYKIEKVEIRKDIYGSDHCPVELLINI